MLREDPPPDFPRGPTEPAGKRVRPTRVDSAILRAGAQPVERAEGGRLAELFRQHGDGAVRLAYLLTGDRSLAEDLVQDAFVKLAGRLVHLRDPGAFEAYLRRTVVNLANSFYRRKRLERAYLKREEGSARTAEVQIDPGARDELWGAMRRLSERQRAAIVLRYYEDLSEQQVAEILKCRPGTVKSLVSRGLATLRGEITDA
jgi:RNA polymerase sigma-70 factor (sigma-E family)